MSTIAIAPDPERVVAVARHLVDAGRVVPALVVDDEGRGRSCWWPLPAATDREMVATLLAEATEEGHRAAADALVQAVDDLTRERLIATGTELVERRPARWTVVESWLLEDASLSTIELDAAG